MGFMARRIVERGNVKQKAPRRSKRMSKEERRSQLLQTALEVIREEGTEALTLARLAERAGVTKPITYEHFGTRSGLLIALFSNYDDKTTAAVREALSTKGETLEGVASILSTSYIDTCLLMGPEVRAVYNSLSTTPETEAFRQSWRDFLIDEFRRGFAPFINLSKKESKPLLIGLLGAAELLAEAALTARVSRSEAITAVGHLMIRAFSQNANEIGKKLSTNRR
jgi:AcrR family transcriptional regulator